jgi:cytochrome c oxidase cbb3-type subunit III
MNPMKQLINPKSMKRLLIKITLILSVFICSPMIIFAQNQDAVAPVQKSDIPEIFFNPAFYLLAGLFLVMLITIIVLSRVLNQLISNVYTKKEEASSSGVAAAEVVKKPSFWTRFDRDILTRAVPIEKEKDIMFEHGIDGIRELDNDLPPWWKYGFYLTIVFAVVYLLHYHVFKTGDLQLAEYNNELTLAANAQQERMLKNADMVTAESVIALKDADGLAQGKDIFMKNCVACHGPLGQGLVGPNLTDEFWIHGGGIKNVFNTIVVGVPAKGMISWKSQLSPKQIQQVGSFILTLQGTNPPGAKEPQGTKWVEPVVASSDTTAVAKTDSTVVVEVKKK